MNREYMNPTSQPYTYQAPAAQTSHKAWKIMGASLLVVALVAGVVAGVMLTKQEALNQASAAPSAAGTVAIATEGSLSPETISVKKGQSVTWTNQDGRRGRSVTPATDSADALKGFGTDQPLAKGESYSYVFSQAGTYHYYDATASQTVGTVIVTE
jgi:plastocyanin